MSHTVCDRFIRYYPSLDLDSVERRCLGPHAFFAVTSLEVEILLLTSASKISIQKQNIYF